MKKAPDIDFNMLASLDVMLTERNMSRAARKLRVSRQTLANHLNVLREDFADQLLVPENNGMALTKRAEELHTPLHEALEALRATLIPKSKNSQNPLEGTIRVAASDYAIDTLVPLIVKRTVSNAPKIELDIRTLNHAALPKQLESGEVDFAISSSPVRSNLLNSELLFRDSLVVIARQSHPIAGDRVDLETYNKLKRVAFWPSSSDQNNNIAWASTSGKQWCENSVKTPSYSSVMDIVRETNLIALIPQRLLKDASNYFVSFEPPEKVPDIPVSVIWHDNTNSNPLVRWACNELVQIGHTLN